METLPPSPLPASQPVQRANFGLDFSPLEYRTGDGIWFIFGDGTRNAIGDGTSSGMKCPPPLQASQPVQRGICWLDL